MSERTIYIRSDPMRVVVKPYPREFGSGINNLLLPDHKAATAWAADLHERHGWPVVDETGDG